MINVGLVYTLEEAYNDKSLLPDPLSIHFGLSFIISVLKDAGYNTSLLVIAPNTNMHSELKKFLFENNLKVIGYTSVATQYSFVSEIAKQVKLMDNSIYNIIGGTHVILDHERVIQNSDFDAVCTGEGEQAIILFVQAIERGEQPAKIPNLWIRDSDTGLIEKNHNIDFNPDLDDLPYIDRKIWEPWIASRPIKTQHILMARGCPFRCSYCSNHILAKTQGGRNLRFRSPENIRGELQQIIADCPDVDSIYFEVETFGANLKYALDFCEGLAKFNKTLRRPIRYGINLAVTGKIAKNGDVLLEAMQKAGFSFVNIGLESGSEKVRKILNRPNYSNQNLIDFSRCARKRGIQVNLYVLIGLPGETPVDFKQTVEAAKQCMPYNCSLGKFYPYPGTILHRVVKENGFIDDNLETTLERRKTVVRMKAFPPWRIEYEYIMFHFRVFSSQMPFYKRILHVGRKIMYLSPKLNSVYMFFAHKTFIGKYLISIMVRSQFNNQSIAKK